MVLRNHGESFQVRTESRDRQKKTSTRRHAADYKNEDLLGVIPARDTLKECLKETATTSFRGLKYTQAYACGALGISAIFKGLT